MPVRAKFSTSYEAKRSRIRRLPRIAERSASASAKRDAYGVIETFKEGIQRGSFKLRPLKEQTVEQKRRKGYRKPTTPLYGLGLEGDNTYINMLTVEREKNRYRVRPRKARHHESGLSLRAMLEIHEYGTTIRRGEKIIRIPPRPAFFMAYRRYLIRRRREEPAEDVRRRMTQYINTGQEELEGRIEARR